MLPVGGLIECVGTCSSLELESRGFVADGPNIVYEFEEVYDCFEEFVSALWWLMGWVQVLSSSLFIALSIQSVYQYQLFITWNWLLR